ncbi:hypothetical protein [Leisingera sp. ANG-M1]|uniref:hypothetical protein n=1 Tax=Leisingera sp. ANG-M1 TaxID=1577895 RepID=UPI00126A71C4|nr:hypothetical protein [Leisingera sp. ANG-M1]
MKSLFLTCLSVLGLTACTSVTTVQNLPISAAEKREVESVTRSALIHPETAEFRGIRKTRLTYSNGKTVERTCGEVKAMNSGGLEDDFRTFLGVLSDGKYTLQGIASPNVSIEDRVLGRVEQSAEEFVRILCYNEMPDRWQ